MENVAGKCGRGMKWFVFLLVISFFYVVENVAGADYTASQFSSMPINIVEEGAKPRIMIASGKDHQLFFKAYNDYSDLNGDGKIDVTYNHGFNYYGYFDSFKCYEYKNERFEPQSFTTTKYCNNGTTGQWSGNFLNWVSMSRIDTIRKILFGGHRRVDTAAATVLERSYLPHDAHSWAKYYAGEDLPKLTPFKKGTDYDADCEVRKDSVTGSTSVHCPDPGSIDLKTVGMTFGNTTDVGGIAYGNNSYSQHYKEPPLIKVVKGNYSLWASNERWQVTWASGAAFDNHSASNANDPSKSLIYAYSDSPAKSTATGAKQYVARVQACVAGLIDDAGVAAVAGSTKEKCKQYPSGNYKPIGLLQTYGDEDRMYFGMIAGTYGKHASGGDLVRDAESWTNEVKVATDGTFPLVAVNAGGPTADNQSSGLVNAWSLYRIVNYNALGTGDNAGSYNGSDNCPWGLSAFSTVTSDNRCHNWGNPLAEIYLQSINYLAGGAPIGPFRSNDSTYISGLNTPTVFKDPLDSSSYCARLSVVMLNPSVISYDADELDTGAVGGPKTIWDPAVLPGDQTSTAMTNYIGTGEMIYGSQYFVGESNMGSGEDQLCTPKMINSNPGLGKVGGLCPEAPRLSGSYRIAGLAYYAHMKDIRPAKHNSRKMSGDQVVDTYAVSLATGAPVIEIPDPSGASKEPVATILPACRNTGLTPNGNCALVDFKIISVEKVGSTVQGKFYINWEDSEQGGDYDQDMWGTLTYTLTGSTLTVTTQVHKESTSYPMAFGYVLSGTTGDGFHAHSGIYGYKNLEITGTGPSCSDTDGCNFGDAASSKTYTLGTSSAKQLKDPLWYAAKWGGFTDSDGSLTPNLQDEWDSKINATGTAGHDGIPDNYFYATNPRQLEDSLDRVLKAILERTSSGTAAAVVSSNVSGEGALYQAYYEPLKKNPNAEARWLGTIQALWLDRNGLTRQDCTPPSDSEGFDSVTGKCLASPANFSSGTCIPNGRLDNYCVDQVVDTYYDTLEKRTRTRIYESDVPDSYTAYSMQGVVSNVASGGAVTMLPNSMEGTAVFTPGTASLTLTPYTMAGLVTAYDATTGLATMKVTSWTGPAGGTYSLWQLSTSSGPGEGVSTDPITPVVDNTFSFTVVPPDTPIAVADTLTLKTKNIIGASGQTFSNWTVQCLAGSAAAGEVNNADLQLNNSSVNDFFVSVTVSGFESCSRAKISTYNLKGTAGKSYSTWKVTNLDTLYNKGASTSPIVLGNDANQRQFTVTPTTNWLTTGDSVLVSNYTFITKELYELGYLWNARKGLYLSGISDTALATNRGWSSLASSGRFIKTWVDANLNGVIDNLEYRDFDKGIVSSASTNYGFFKVSDAPTANRVVDFVRGINVTGGRNRTIQYAEGEPQNVMRLGDIVNSTPAVVAAPQESFDLLYKDATYRTFRQRYIDRRIMIYTGANDGLLHAFNGGFYNKTIVNANTANEKSYINYSEKGKYYKDGVLTDVVEHPLGSEIWAYAPYNLLSHLQWLIDPEYGKKTHVYYMDGKPRIFDAKIFAEDNDHPSGWGTVMVVGMNLGGGKMEFTLPAPATPNFVKMQSAYVVFDITNPEVEPKLLAEITMPDSSFTTVYPAIVSFQNQTDNSWYLMFGTGPNQLDDYYSSQSAKVYLFDLGQLRTKTPAPSSSTATSSLPPNCVVSNLNSIYNLLACNTGQMNSFVGTPSVVDWDLDFKADTAYFGLVGRGISGTTQYDDGKVMRFGFKNQAEISQWDGIKTFYNTGKPVVAQPVPAIDNLGKHWIFFGTGRYFSAPDKSTADAHYLYGVKDPEYAVTTSYPILVSQLLDTSNAEVYTDGSVTGVSGFTTFAAIETAIDTAANLGWRMYLPPIVGDATAPSTRSLTRSALLGGVLFTSVFQPSSDPCAGEGRSRLFGLYYKTGTANPTKNVFGTSVEQVGNTVKYRANKFLDLGQGVATAPALHSGRGSGSDELKVFTQLSTGEIIESEAATINKIRSGRTSWQEK